MSSSTRSKTGLFLARLKNSVNNMFRKKRQTMNQYVESYFSARKSILAFLKATIGKSFTYIESLLILPCLENVRFIMKCNLLPPFEYVLNVLILFS